jgi:hypothetical protein
MPMALTAAAQRAGPADNKKPASLGVRPPAVQKDDQRVFSDSSADLYG